MRSFTEIHQMAAGHHGGAEALEELLTSPLSSDEIRAAPDDRWLSAATKCIFQAGFNWQLIEDKWPRFEEVFEGFDIGRWALMSDIDIDRLLKMEGIVANAAKIASVGDNAAYFLDLARAHGSVGAYFAGWRIADYCTNLRALRRDGARLGGTSGQIFLRRMGVDTLVFSNDVVKALDREGVVAKPPVSGKDLAAVQAAVDQWHGESGRSLTQISQILAYAVG